MLIRRANQLLIGLAQPAIFVEGSKHGERPDNNAMLNMATHDRETNVVLPAEVPADLPLPSDPKVLFLGGLFVLAVLGRVDGFSKVIG